MTTAHPLAWRLARVEAHRRYQLSHPGQLWWCGAGAACVWDGECNPADASLVFSEEEGELRPFHAECCLALYLAQRRRFREWGRQGAEAAARRAREAEDRQGTVCQYCGDTCARGGAMAAHVKSHQR